MNRVKKDNYSWLMENVVYAISVLDYAEELALNYVNAMEDKRKDFKKAKERAVSLGDDNMALQLTNELNLIDGDIDFENGYRAGMKYALSLIKQQLGKKDDNE